MKVVILNTYNIGGAGIAATRLWKALTNKHVKCFLLVRSITTSKSNYNSISNSFFKKIKATILFFAERIYFLFYHKNLASHFSFSPGITGFNLSKHSFVKNADIIHLNWINHGFISLKSIRKLIETKKPVVITLHDSWFFTGGCHLPFNCTNYKNECGNCIYLNKPAINDLSNKGILKKKELYKNNNVTFIACSKWMQKKAISSNLLKFKNVFSIPNPINTNIFKPSIQYNIRASNDLPLEKTLILFGALNANSKNKGFNYLIDGLEELVKLYPDYSKKIELVITGRSKVDLSKLFPINVNYLGNIVSEQKMANVYQAVDLFVLPTLMDNLPNMVIESMSCETPVVSFNVGGVPEIIDHLENGYVANYKSSDDLANGIKWMLDNNKDNVLGKAARKKVIREYSEEVIAQKYIDLYESLLNGKQS